MKLLRNDCDRVRMRVLGRRILLLSHPNDFEQVLVRDQASYGRSVEIRTLRPIFGEGLLSSEGEHWSRQRRIIQPSFRHDALTNYASIMLSVIGRQTSEWREGAVVDIHHEMMRYTRETICTVLFGKEFLVEQTEVAEAVTTVFGNLRGEILYLPVWRWLPSSRSRKWNRAVKFLNDVIRTTIENRRSSGARSNDLLQALLDACDEDGTMMSDQQVHDEILTFFLAGHETATLGLTWAIYLLTAHPTVQEHIRREVQTTADETGGITPESYAKLRLTTAAVKESMRLYPPVWSMGREVVADTVLGDQEVKKGTSVWLCLYALQRDSRWFPAPDSFMPERWLQSTVKPFTYIPFGIGQRVCIGQHFAMTEIVLGLATILNAFRLERVTSREPKLSPWITLRPQEPILVRLSK